MFTRSCLPLSLAARAFAIALVAVPLSHANAQGTADRLERLERDLANLQRYLYSGAPGGPVGGGAGGIDPSYRERVEVRLGGLESELRDMTGRVEEMGFAVRRMQERVDKLVQDVDFRLTAIERAVQSGGGPGPAAAPPAPTAAAAPSPRAAEPPPLAVTGTAPRVPAPAAPEPTRPGPAPAPVALPAGSEMEQYSFAQRLVAQTRYDEAEGALREFLRRHPNSQLADNARYWLGETYYVRRRYEDAAGTFLDAYQANPKGSKAADSLLKLGLSLSALRKTQEACVALNKLTREHPNSEGVVLRRAEQEKSQLACG